MQLLETESPLVIVPLTSFAVASISFGCVWCMQFIYLTNDYKENFGREDSSARSHTQSAEMTHLLSPFFAQDKTCFSSPGVRLLENGPRWPSSCTQCRFCSLELEAWSWTVQRMNPPEYPDWAWAPGHLIPAPLTDLQQLRISCSVWMASLCYSVPALNTWTDWWYRLDSQPHCACHPVFILLSSSLIKSPIAGVGIINQHLRIYSRFHAVLSIASNTYFIVHPFDLTLSLYKVYCWGGGEQPACIWIWTTTWF